MQALLPSPNGMYVYGVIESLRSSLNRSGSNFSGFEKYLGSLCNPNSGINTLVPFGITVLLPGIL